MSVVGSDGVDGSVAEEGQAAAQRKHVPVVLCERTSVMSGGAWGCAWFANRLRYLLLYNSPPPFACKSCDRLTVLRIPVAKLGEKRSGCLGAVHR